MAGALGIGMLIGLIKECIKELVGVTLVLNKTFGFN